MLRVSIIISLLSLYLFGTIVCPPVTERPETTPKPEETAEKDEKLGLEYERYLKEVVAILESDESFRKKLEESNISDIKSGEIAKHLDFVGHGIRTRLDEIKRKEVDRLRQVMRLRGFLQKGLKASHPGIVLQELNKEKILGHLDHSNPNTFEVADLAKLIKQATQDLEEIDTRRKEEFKNYEMEKEVLRREQLKGLDEAQRQEEEKKQEEMQKKHEDHPKLHHPGNEEQLKEVWAESDGLDKKDFEPKTFFHLHDTNGDGYLDLAEVEALFQKELDKVYDPNAPEDDMMERYEETNRMREHWVKENDKNKDQLISLKEFVDSTNSDGYKKEEGWEPIDKEDVYTEEELAQFQKNYEQQLKLEHEQKQQQQQQQQHEPQVQHEKGDGEVQVPQKSDFGDNRVNVPGEGQVVQHPAGQPVVPQESVQQPVVQQHEQQHVVQQQQEQQQPVVQQQQQQEQQLPVVQQQPEQQQQHDQLQFVPQQVQQQGNDVLQPGQHPQQPVVDLQHQPDVQQEQRPGDVQQPQGHVEG